jgi:uncharacterized protein
MEPLVRAFDSAIEVEGDGRTVVGLLAPYNEDSIVDDGFGPYVETFMPGCFDRAISGKASYLKVQLEHHGRWVGRGSLWRDMPHGLMAELRLDNTEAGREAAFKIQDGQTPGLSLSFYPGNKDARGQRNGMRHVMRHQVRALNHVALCQFPAYQSALVEAVRSREEPARTADRVAYWQRWTERVKRV